MRKGEEKNVALGQLRSTPSRHAIWLPGHLAHPRSTGSLASAPHYQYLLQKVLDCSNRYFSGNEFLTTSRDCFPGRAVRLFTVKRFHN